MQYSAVTHRGYVREQNEDAYYLPGAKGAPGNLAIVADGMGGHRAGEVASAMAVRSAVIAFGRLEDTPGMTLREKIFQAMNEANREVYEATQESEQYAGMGTTMTLAVLEEKKIDLGHVGDSRAYLFHEGTLRQITRDHTLVQQLIDLGELLPQERRGHPQGNIITRALGTARIVDVDLIEEKWQRGDVLLLCSDGLTGAVTDEEIAAVLGGQEPREALQTLLGLALKRGGRDNITIALILHGGDTQ